MATRSTPPSTGTLEASRSRRSVLAAAVAAGGALAVQAIARPAPAVAASVVLGAVNSAAAPTTIQNTAVSSTARALIGQVTTTGSGSSTVGVQGESRAADGTGCLLYTSPSPRDGLLSRMPSSA